MKKKKKLKQTDAENVEEERKLLEQKHELILKMRNYRPSGTIFELNPHNKSVPLEVMKQKRSVHSEVIQKFHTKMEELNKEEEEKQQLHHKENTLPESNDADITTAFNKVVTSKKRKNMDALYKPKKKKKGNVKDEEHFVPYQSADKHTEEGFAINTFERQVQGAEFSVVNKDQEIKHKPGMKKWDRIRKKMVAVQDPRQGKIRTESGVWIPATYKTGRYNEWKEKTKIEEQVWREQDDDSQAPLTHEKRYPISRWARHNAKVDAKKHSGVDSELKNPEQIVKRRLRLEFLKKRELENRIKKAANRRKHMKKMKSRQKK